MKKIALIPARYGATRFPAKLMQLIGNKTVIQHTYESTITTKLFDDVIVVTDSEMIFHEVLEFKGKAILSKGTHESGSDRIAEAVNALDVDIVINVQGDTPFISKEPLEKLLSQFKDSKVKVASIMKEISKDEVSNPNFVKVVVDKNFNALLFSRSIIPYTREKSCKTRFYKHIGVYGYRKQTLLSFTNLEQTPLEIAEKIESLRYLENGIPIRMSLVDYNGIEIDTPEDLQKAIKFFNN